MARKRSGRYSVAAEKYISRKIKLLRKERIKQSQAEAIALSMARAKHLKVPPKPRR